MGLLGAVGVDRFRQEGPLLTSGNPRCLVGAHGPVELVRGAQKCLGELRAGVP